MILRLCQAKLFDKQRGYYEVYYCPLGFLWQRKRNEVDTLFSLICVLSTFAS